jgi:hypothetical protein
MGRSGILGSLFTGRNMYRGRLSRAVNWLLLVLIPTASCGSTPAVSSWRPGVAYKAGTVATYRGLRSLCVQGHASQVGWEPPNTPMLWKVEGTPAEIAAAVAAPKPVRVAGALTPTPVPPAITTKLGTAATATATATVRPAATPTRRPATFTPKTLPEGAEIDGAAASLALEAPAKRVASGPPSWVPNVLYDAGSRVVFGGSTYRCLQTHASVTGWEPPTSAALWSREGPSV